MVGRGYGHALQQRSDGPRLPGSMWEGVSRRLGESRVSCLLGVGTGMRGRRRSWRISMTPIILCQCMLTTPTNAIL